jgi:predicted nucleotidyltransferase
VSGTRYINQPKHRRLVSKAVKFLIRDKRVRGLYLSGSTRTDEYSDIDLTILSTEQDRESLEKDRLKIASQLGEIEAEAMSLIPHTYVVFFHQDEIKFDFNFHAIPERNRPDKADIEILYDPTGQLHRLVEESAKMTWTIDLDELSNIIKHFYVAISYTLSKIARGELWESRDCVEYYRQLLLMFEDILAKRKREGYRRLEQKLSARKLALLKQTIPKGLTPTDIFSSLDKIFGYFDTFLKGKFADMSIFPTEYATEMIKYYHKKKKEVLKKRTSKSK